MFDLREQEVLLAVSRGAIETYLQSRLITKPPLESFLQVPAGAFVTLKIGEDLRGCIGSIEATEPLGETIVHCAISAAFRDPRFPPLTAEEYPLIRLEISVLSALRPSQPQDVIPGTHGVIITRGYNRGLLLPQVATENDWDAETFLSYTCRKAGLPPDAWKHPDTLIETFTAFVFGEKALNTESR